MLGASLRQPSFAPRQVDRQFLRFTLDQFPPAEVLPETGFLGVFVQVAVLIRRQDAVQVVQAGQAVAQETELAGTHPPGVGEQLTHQCAVARRVDPFRDLQRVPADRAYAARVQLTDVHPALQPRPMQGLAPALSEIQHDRAVMPAQGGLKGQPFGGHGFSVAGVAGKGGMEVTLRGETQEGGGQVAALGGIQACQGDLPAHVRIEGKWRDGFLHRARQAFLEETGGHVRGGLQHGQQGRIGIGGHGLRDVDLAG